MKVLKDLYFNLKENEKYIVDIEIHEKEKKQYMQYTCEIKPSTKGIKYNRVEIYRTEQRIMPEVNDSFFEMLQHTTSLWQRLVLDINNYGNIMKIVNLKDIQKYWDEDLGFRLKHSYKGRIAEQVIKGVEKTIYSEEIFLKKISQDLFFSTWLKPLYGEYYYASNTGRMNSTEVMHYTNGEQQIKNWVFNGIIDQDKQVLVKGDVIVSENLLESFKKNKEIESEEKLNWKERCRFTYSEDLVLKKAIWKQIIDIDNQPFCLKRVIIEKMRL